MAHDEAEVPVEAAASLFDVGDEAAPDFFASAFDSHLPEDESSLTQPDPGVASNLFEAAPIETTSSLFQSTSYDPFQPDSSVGSDSRSKPGADQHSQLDSQQYQNQGWQDEHGQWHAYNDQNRYTSTYDYASQAQATAAYVPPTEYFPQQQYDFASPPSSMEYTPQQHHTGYSKTHDLNTTHQPSHQNIYAPSAPQSAYEPVHTAAHSTGYPQSNCNPYAPAVQPPTNPPPVAAYGAPIVASLNTRSPSDVNAYRPTSLNAYDPPVPSKTRSKARSALYTPSATTAAPNGLRHQHANPPPPPPPPPPPSSKQNLMFQGPPSVYTESPRRPLDANGFAHDQGPAGWPQAHDVGYAPYAAHGLSQNHGEKAHGAATTEGVPDLPIESTDDPGSARPLEHGGFDDEVPDQPRPGGLAEEGQPSYGIEPTGSSYAHDPEDGHVYYSSHGDAVPVVQPEGTDGPEHHLASYSLDDQPFGGGQNSADVYAPSASPPPLTGSPTNLLSYPARSTAGGDPHSYDPYHPAQHSRQNSDASHVGSTLPQMPSASTKPWDPYAPPVASARFRSDSEVSVSHSTHEAHHLQGASSNDATPFGSSYGPYTPSSRLQRVDSRHSDVSFDGEYTSRYNYTHEPDAGPLEGVSGVPFDLDTTTDNTNVLMAPTYAPYAPSPSLLGTNDPLGRASARVPVISFGFGGNLVSCFHSAGETATGFDVSLTARQSTDVQLRTLHEVIPASAMDSSAFSFPGPLFFDPGAPSISLARTVGVGVASNIKAKKALVSKWLEDRATEVSSGVAYISSGSQERYNVEGRLALIRLLKAMVDNDGQLSGSPSIEWAVRSALVPRLGSERPPAAAEGLLSESQIPSYAPAVADVNEPSLAVYHLRPSALDRIQEFLLRGERRQAYLYALDEKLWAHAMLIASSAGTQAWKEVVSEFMHSELAIKQPPGSLGLKPEGAGSCSNGRESLRVAYSLFAGHGAAAVQELIPPRALPAPKESMLAPPTGFHPTPISPNFPQPALTSSIPPESLARWQETAAVMAFSQTTGDSAALTALGDYLAANRWFEAAHACYLLSPRTSSLGGTGVSSVRVVLVGCENPGSLRNFHKDLDVTLFSEIVEFALSLSPAKGQDAFGGLPHLQAYKLIRAAHLAEMGQVELANRYCEAIGSTIRASSRGSQFYTPTFIGELKNLSDQLTAAPQLDKTASWISRKMAKPSLDSIGGWLEGRFSKLIVGDGDDTAEPPASATSQPKRPAYGPFSHYSTISSATTSASPSPSPTPYAQNGNGRTPVLPGMPGVPLNSPGPPHFPIDRASSAMDHLRPEVRRASPVQRVASASAATTTFAQALNPIARYRQTHGGVSGVPEGEAGGEAEGQEVSWWGSGSQDRNGPTPTAATFHKVDEAESGGNFVSLMDDYSPGVTPMAARSSQSISQSNREDMEEEEDLGFGNRASKTPKPDQPSSGQEAKDKAKTPVPDKPDLKQQSSSWFGRWWSRSSDPVPTGPVKAKLGEETSFYYDKELKRWVNKKAGGADTSAPAPPPPPPSRPRTASPAPGGTPDPKTAAGPPTGPPPTRPASAADLTMPPRKPPRVRSNLVPQEDSMAPGSAPPSAASFETSQSGPGLAPPSGIGRPKSSSSKRNVRSRYVDVLQQQSES